MAAGNGYKRCKCRDADGRELGAKCPKLRRKGGAWNPNHGTWYGKEELPKGADGKRVDLRLGGFKTETELIAFFEKGLRLLGIPEAGPEGHEARMEIRAMIKAANKQQAPLPDYEELHRKHNVGQPLQSITLGEYWEYWVERRRRLKDIRESTLISYLSNWRTHIREVLSGVRLDRLFVPVVEQVFTEIDRKNEALLAARVSDDPEVQASVRGKHPTGPVTKQQVRATIRTVLASAEREHLVSFNAAKLVKLAPGEKVRGLVWTPSRVEAFNGEYERRLAAKRAGQKRPRRAQGSFEVWLGTPRPSPVMVWTPVQLGAFLDHAMADRLYALYHLIAFCGLRRGEACGVRWIDADLDENLLATVKQLTKVGRAVKEGATKTHYSNGTVALDQATAAVLRAHRARQDEERLVWGPAWTDTGRIFTKEDGRDLTPDWVSTHFERLTFQAGLPPTRLHDLRHGAATLSLAAGNDMKTTSAMLRHSTVSITADLYTTVLPEVAWAAAEASAALVPRSTTV
ncbi:Phage integrase family protein [Nonomuraea solani]|uniref:Phage integrase family protein n=1 Tax=Nonomuraea solani TaxID=1144553 RepID=A0A1H6EVR9_9ACTN|nr:site-specific integrase [Nonomuraea solani]SEH01947.1 Phage integrase family protein [Nonomuraea solani]